MSPNKKVQSFEVTLPPELQKYYNDKNKELGAGGFAKVILAEHIATGEKVAIKVMNKSFLSKKDDLHRAYNEIYALKHLSHHNICQLYEVFECSEYIYLVIEYCPGGELFDYIVSKKRLAEREARAVFRQVLSAVAYIHKNGYAHRDLKPENMLLDGNKKLKIIDFGLSAKPEKGLTSPLRTRAGSALYASPELISGEPYYGNETDVWSLGVVLYALLCGFLPFDHETTSELYRKIKKGEFATPPWLTKSSLNLLRSMLEVNPKKRISVEELLDHEWITTGFDDPVTWQPKIQRKSLNYKAVQLIAAYFKWSLADAESKILLFKYNQLTSFYFILCKMSQKNLIKLRSIWLHRDNFVGEVNKSLNGHHDTLPDVTAVDNGSRTRSKTYIKHFLAKENDLQHQQQQQRARSSTLNDIDEDSRVTTYNTINDRNPHDKDLENNDKNSKLHQSKLSKSLADGLNKNKIADSEASRKHELKFRERCNNTIERLWSRGRMRSNTLHTILPNSLDKTKTEPNSRDDPIIIVDEINPETDVQRRNRKDTENEKNHDSLDNSNLHKTKKLAASCMDSLDSMKHEHSQHQPTSKSMSLDVKRPERPERRDRTRSLKDFTRRLSGFFRNGSEPRTGESSPRSVKAMYHVENTTSLSPHAVKKELERVLNLLVKSEDLISYVNVDNYLFKCKGGKNSRTMFELEICYVPYMEKTVGIRRKRLKGDSWSYKELVERVLSLAKL